MSSSDSERRIMSLGECMYNEFQNILMIREQKMKMEMENLVRDRDSIKEELRLLQKTEGLAGLEKLKIQEKLQRSLRNCKDLKATIAILEEKERVSIGRYLEIRDEIEELRRHKVEADEIVAELRRQNLEANRKIDELRRELGLESDMLSSISSVKNFAEKSGDDVMDEENDVICQDHEPNRLNILESKELHDSAPSHAGFSSKVDIIEMPDSYDKTNPIGAAYTSDTVMQQLNAAENEIIIEKSLQNSLSKKRNRTDYYKDDSRYLPNNENENQVHESSLDIFEARDSQILPRKIRK